MALTELRPFRSPSSSSSSSGAPRGRSGWSGGRAGSEGAVPPPSGAPDGRWGSRCLRVRGADMGNSKWIGRGKASGRRRGRTGYDRTEKTLGEESRGVGVERTVLRAFREVRNDWRGKRPGPLRSGASLFCRVCEQSSSPHPFSPSSSGVPRGGVVGPEGGLAPKARCFSPTGAPDGGLGVGGLGVLACAWSRHATRQRI